MRQIFGHLLAVATISEVLPSYREPESLLTVAFHPRVEAVVRRVLPK